MLLFGLHLHHSPVIHRKFSLLLTPALCWPRMKKEVMPFAKETVPLYIWKLSFAVWTGVTMGALLIRRSALSLVWSSGQARPRSRETSLDLEVFHQQTSFRHLRHISCPPCIAKTYRLANLPGAHAPLTMSPSYH